MRDVQSFTPLYKEAAGDRPFLNVLWPCLLQTVSVQCEQRSVNLFEKVVLNLIAAGLEDRQAQADALCLERDLLEFICLRLEQKQLLYGSALTARGKAFLAGTAKGEDTTAFIYSDLLGLKPQPLPFVSVSKPQFLLPAEQNNVYYLGDIGDTEKRLYKPWVLQPTAVQIKPNTQTLPTTLSAPTVLELLRRFMALHQTTPLLPQITRELPRFILNDSASIAVQPQAQLVYLHCVCVLEQDGSVQVLNPFGYADALPELTQSLLSYSGFDAVKKKLLETAVSPSRSLEPQAQTQAQRQLKYSGYVELDAEINKAWLLLDRYRQQLQATHPDASKEESLSRGYISAVYSAFEYMLRRIYQQSRGEQNSVAEAWERVLMATNAQQIRTYVRQALTSLGVPFDESVVDFVAVSPEEITAALSGNGSLRSLLALNVCCPQNPAAAILRVVASQNQFFPETLHSLKQWRDPISHGQSVNYVKLAKEEGLSVLAKIESFAALLRSWLYAWREQAPMALPPETAKKVLAEPTNISTITAMHTPSSAEVELALLEFFPQAKRRFLLEDTLHELQLTELGFQAAGITPQATTAKVVTAPVMSGPDGDVVSANATEGPHDEIAAATAAAQVPTQCLTTLAGFYQRLLQDLTTGLPPAGITLSVESSIATDGGTVDVDDTTTTTVAHLNTKCLQAGFRLKHGSLPQALVASVRKTKTSKDLKRLTLGTALILWLQRVTPESLTLVAQARPNFITNAAQLITLRAHGQGFVDAAAAAQLRQEIYADCAALLGD